MVIKCLMKQIFLSKELIKENIGVHKQSVSKQGRKFAKGESSVQRDPLFDVIPEDTVDHMEIENAQDEGRSREMVDEDKEINEKILSTEDVLSADKEGVNTVDHLETEMLRMRVRQNEGTEEKNEGTEEKNDRYRERTIGRFTVRAIESTDGHKVKVLLNMSQAKAVSREKEKGVELKDIEEADRPRPTSARSLLTLKPLPKIDPKDKGKKKMKRRDEYESEEERNRIAEEKAANEALIRNFDNIKAMIEADRLLAEKLQEQEREQFTIKERAKFLHDTIVAQRKFLAQQRSEAIRNRPPTKNQLRNQMMTYLKHRSIQQGTHKDETCLVAQAPDEICLGVNLEPDEWIKDSGCSKHMTSNRSRSGGGEARLSRARLAQIDGRSCQTRGSQDSDFELLKADLSEAEAA
ncbi:hypothetical protein Tco_0085829 [Tanacetum coccineum]